MHELVVEASSNDVLENQYLSTSVPVILIYQFVLEYCDLCKINTS